MSKVVIFGRENCKYCSDAKDLSEKNGIKYEWKDVSDFDTKEELINLVPSAKTIPQIFVNNKHIGGFTEYDIFVRENLIGVGKFKD